MNTLKKKKVAFIAAWLVALLVIGLVTFGLSQTLRGTERQVFTMVESVQDDFKDPDSVELVGGTLLSTGDLMCTIRAKNGFGAFDTEQYIITENGEIYANTGKYEITGCDSAFNNKDDFNVDRINKKLKSE